jgi:dihydroorotase
MSLGAGLAEVVRMSTWSPACIIGQRQLGHLDLGAEADIAVLRLERGDFGMVDSAGARRPGTQALSCEMTVRKGAVVWDRNGRAAGDWRTFPYRRTL